MYLLNFKPTTHLGGIIFIFFLLNSLLLSESSRSIPITQITSLSGFVRTNNTQFFLNGSPFYFNGFNSYWMMHAAFDPLQRSKITSLFKDASAVGLTVCRTWAFSDGGDRPLQISPGVYSEPMFQALDFVISEARKYGIRLILSLVNNFNNYGGKQQYTQWGEKAGEKITSDDEFYTNPVIKGFFKNHIKRVLTRINTFTKLGYKDDPTIMAWELINEPRCFIDFSGRTIQKWVQEMATYTKSIDNKHLLEIGMEGFYGDSMPDKKQNNPGYQVGTDFISNNLVKEIDFATMHAYPIWLLGQSENVQLGFTQRWMESHWRDSMEILKKPLVFAEFGKSNRDQAYTNFSRNSYLSTIYKDIYKFASRGGTIGGGLVWHIVAKGMESYHDGYEIILSKNKSTTRIIARQSLKMANLCGMPELQLFTPI